jgi:hypothetical protein
LSQGFDRLNSDHEIKITQYKVNQNIL